MTTSWDGFPWHESARGRSRTAQEGWKSAARREKVRLPTSTPRGHDGRSERGRHPTTSRYVSSARSRSSGTARPRARRAEAARAPRRRSRSSRDASSPSTGSSRRSGRAIRPRRPRTQSRSTSRSSARRSARVIATRAPGYVLELDPERVDVAPLRAPARRRGGPRSTTGDAEPRPRARCARRSRSGAARRSRTSSTSRSRRREIARLEELRTVVARGADRGRSRARAVTPSSSPSSRRSSQAAAAARAAARAAHARALPLGPPGRRARRLPRRARDARRGARHRPRPGAARARGRDPPPGRLAAPRGDTARAAGDAVPAARHDPLRRRRRVDGARGGARPGGARRVLQSYFETVSAAITRHGGTVEKYAGDAVMAAFGIPVSHEDDALRAARAALDIRVGIAALNEQLVQQHGVGLEIRIGIETGRGRRDADGCAPAARHRRGGRDRGEARGGRRRGRDRRRRARGSPDRPRGDARAARGRSRSRASASPSQAYRLVELDAVAPAFEQRQDAPLVGRKRELAALRRTLKRAVDGSRRSRRGGDRLAGRREVASRGRADPPREGRHDALGSLPLLRRRHHVLAASRGRSADATESDERDAVLAALDAETPPPAPELAWLFRRFCEASARERPLVLVFDDVHWAEPTFLELVEHLADKGDGADLVVCLAREELLEDRPAFLEGRANADRIVLDALSATRRTRCSTASAGRSSSRISAPASSRPRRATRSSSSSSSRSRSKAASPSARCRRRSRRCSLRASTGSARASGPCSSAARSSGRSSRPTTSSRCSIPTPRRPPIRTSQTLAGRGFVRPRGDDAFGFRHVLVQEAVYRAAPKRLRAELHERYADRLDSESPDLPELDEFVGYHLEQAYRLRTELGEERSAHGDAERGCRASSGDGGSTCSQARRHAGDDQPARPSGGVASGGRRKAPRAHVRARDRIHERGRHGCVQCTVQRWRRRVLRRSTSAASSCERRSKLRTDVS